jgi:D-alanyl-D-alanine carboxypeptidase
MKQKILLSLFAVLILSFAGNTQVLAISREQQSEILQQEIVTLSSLVRNYNLYQEPGAGSYIAVDISSNKVLLQKNSDSEFSMASVTKLMNAVISVENINMDNKITLTGDMLLPAGQTSTLYSGLRITAKDLLRVTVTQSSNDSAEALSYFLGREHFIRLMNQKARELGMSKTVYEDTNGLSLKNTSTTTDLAKLMTYVYKNHPQILEMTKDNNFWLPDQTGRMLKFKNENSFYYLSSFVGGKAGYLDEAKNTFNSVFNVNGKPVAIAILYSRNQMADIFSILRKLGSGI